LNSRLSSNAPRRRRTKPFGNGHEAAVVEAEPLEALLAEDRSRAGRWHVPNALRVVPLDVEVLKAKHGRTHARVALTYDMIANYITDGRTDGAPEIS